MNETELQANGFNITIATNNAYRRWGFAIEDGGDQILNCISVDEKGLIEVNQEVAENENCVEVA